MRLPIALPLLVAPWLVACPRPPTPARVDPSKVTQLAVHTGGGVTEYCPHGAAVQLGASVTLVDGKVIETWAPGASVEGRLELDKLEWTTSWGVVDAEGRLRLPDDPIGALDRDVTVQARLVDRPDLVAQLTLAPTFGCGGTIGDVGVAGVSGSWGPHGEPGRDGEDGDDDDAPGDGGDGSDGGAGGDGGDGGPGPVIEAAVTRLDTERHGALLAVRVVTGGATGLYLVDPDGAPFSIVALGGAGGSGGAGGNGGNGGAGGDDSSKDGQRAGNGGRAGDGGRGGRGGDGGDGGEIVLYVDARYPELGRAIGLSTAGGAAGAGGYGGYGGQPGRAGTSSNGDPGTAGTAGAQGPDGPDGHLGRDGQPPRVTASDDLARWFTPLVDAGIWTPPGARGR